MTSTIGCCWVQCTSIAQEVLKGGLLGGETMPYPCSAAPHQLGQASAGGPPSLRRAVLAALACVANAPTRCLPWHTIHLRPGKLSTKKKGAAPSLLLESFIFPPPPLNWRPCHNNTSRLVYLCFLPTATDNRCFQILPRPSTPSIQNGWSTPPCVPGLSSLARHPTPRCLRGTRRRIVS